MLVRAVFFDRDGTLNYDPGYLGDPNLVKLYPNVPEGIRKLKDNGFKIIVISNQSGIARKLITHSDVRAVNKRINEILSDNNSEVNDFYYCSSHPDFSSLDECKCRKPSPSMVFTASKEHNIDLKNSFFVGDKAIDVECGNNAGIETILVMNGKNKEEINSLQKQDKSVNFIAKNFLDACNHILQKVSEEIA